MTSEQVVLRPQKLSGTQTNKATHHTRNVRSVSTPVAISLPAGLGAESSSRDPAEAPATAPATPPATAPSTAPATAPSEHDGDEGEGDEVEGDEHHGLRSRGAYTALAAAWSSAIMEQRRRDHLPVADAASVAAAAVALAAATCFTPPPILLSPVARAVSEEEGCEEGCEEGWAAESSSVRALLNTSSDAAQPLHTPLHTDAAQPPAASGLLMAEGGGDADSPRRGVVDFARKWLWRAPGSGDSLRKRAGTKPR